MQVRILPSLCVAALLTAGGTPLIAQALPATQPKILQIFRERIKPGLDAAHATNESGWPLAYARAKSPDYYLAMVSMTGGSEIWYTVPHGSYTAWDKSMARDNADAGLSAELARLSTADGQYLEEGSDAIEAVAAPELSNGAFPDLSKQRFWQITVWRIRPGHGGDFAAATAAYKKIVERAGVTANWRTYRVTGGMPGGTYINFSSVQSFGQFDAAMAENAVIGKAMTPEDRAMFDKFFSESVISTVSNKFQLSSTMSYVSPETKAADPAFWK